MREREEYLKKIVLDEVSDNTTFRLLNTVIFTSVFASGLSIGYLVWLNIDDGDSGVGSVLAPSPPSLSHYHQSSMAFYLGQPPSPSPTPVSSSPSPSPAPSSASLYNLLVAVSATFLLLHSCLFAPNMSGRSAFSALCGSLWSVALVVMLALIGFHSGTHHNVWSVSFLFISVIIQLCVAVSLAYLGYLRITNSDPSTDDPLPPPFSHLRKHSVFVARHVRTLLTPTHQRKGYSILCLDDDDGDNDDMISSASSNSDLSCNLDRDVDDGGNVDTDGGIVYSGGGGDGDGWPPSLIRRILANPPSPSPWVYEWSFTEKRLQDAESWKGRAALYGRSLAESTWDSIRGLVTPAAKDPGTEDAVVYFPQRLLFAAGVSVLYVTVLSAAAIYLAVLILRTAHEMDSEAGVFKALTRALGASVMGAAIINWIAAMAMWRSVFIRTKNNLLGMRRGEYPFNPQKFSMMDGVYYTPYQIVHSSFGLLVSIVVISLFLLIVFVPVFYSPARAAAASLVSKFFYSVILNAVLWWFLRAIFVKLFFVRWGWLTNRVQFAWYEYASAYLNVATGITSVLKRLAISLILNVAFIWRLDMPAYTSGFETLDSGYGAYVGMLLLHHQYRSPVAVAAYTLFATRLTQLRLPTTTTTTTTTTTNPSTPLLAPTSPISSPISSSTSSHRISVRARTRWMVAFTLIRNPSLIPYRKRMLDLRSQLIITPHAAIQVLDQTV